MKIAVLLGGTSSERDISLVSGIAIAKALMENGHIVEAIDCAYGDLLIEDIDRDINKIISDIPSDIENNKNDLDQNIIKTVQYLKENKFDLVFNALHGGYGENGQLQAILELNQIKYTGSDSISSTIGMNKHYSKILFEKYGVPIASGITLKKGNQLNYDSIEKIGFPIVVKPNNQGSTVGLTIVDSLNNLEESINEAFNFGNVVLLEKYIAGKELTVGILDQSPLPAIEIIPQSGFYDYVSKYQTGKTDYICPADLPEEYKKKLLQFALDAYNALSCRHYARVDFRMNDNYEIFCLEVNTLPGMTPTSLVPKAAKAIDLNFNDLIAKIITIASQD